MLNFLSDNVRNFSSAKARNFKKQISQKLYNHLQSDHPEEKENQSTWKTYNKHVENSISAHKDKHQAMAQAIGGNFIPFGVVMRELLKSEGLRPNDHLVDIGCGSGRLPYGVKDYLKGKLLGIDVVPSLVEHAREITSRPDWTFVVGSGLNISADDATIDMVTAFSLFTHLRHEQSYAYLQDAVRVLRPGGKIIFSFLQFPVACHWDVFEANLNNLDTDQHLNQFMSVDAIEVWAKRLGLKVVSINDGDKPHIKINEDIKLDDGRVFKNLACLGQSICVLKKLA